MSRIGKQPITIPSGVEVTIDGANVTVKGPKGSSSTRSSAAITIARDGDTLSSSGSTTRARTARFTVSATLIANMVTGVSEGFSKDLEIVGVGYRAPAQGPEKIEIAVGFSHPVYVQAPAGHHVRGAAADPHHVRGFDKQLVGQVAADIRKLRKPEPYKGKGIRYAGERVQRKAGKSAK